MSFKSMRHRFCECAIVISIMVTGCASPPSVAPLLRVAERAMREEAGRIDADTQRDDLQLDQARQGLDAGFDADLVHAPRLDAAWVRDAARIYAAAREELVRHELALREERARRADDLRAAAEAQARAISLLEKQDELITQTTGLDIWRLQITRPFSNTTSKETH